jgi:hypothetical protein
MGFLGFSSATLPLDFIINRGGEELSTPTPYSHTNSMHDLAFSLPPSEIVS